MSTKIMNDIRYDSREEWLADRKNGIGGSESAAAIGASPWMSAIELWGIKTGRIEPDNLDEVERVRWGSLLEPVIGQEFGERTGRDVRQWNQLQVITHDAYSFIRCTPDAFQDDTSIIGTGLLQIKTTSEWNKDDWRDGNVPLHYQVQVQHELAVTGCRWASIACLVGGQKLEWVDVERNEPFIEALIARLKDFWACVVNDVEPPPDSSLSCAKALKALHPDDNGETAIIDADNNWPAKLAEAKRTIKEQEAIATEAENHIRSLIGDNTFAVFPDGTIFSYKTQERKGYEVKPSKTRVLRTIKQLPKGAL